MRDDATGKIALVEAGGRPRPEVIAETLEQLIARGRWSAGERLPNESELAWSMGVARSSVRTALQRLENKKLLEVRRGLGWYVRQRPADDRVSLSGMLADHHYQVKDLFELRIGLENLAVRLAAGRATAAEIDTIKKLGFDHEMAGEDRESLQETDEALHEAIVRASHNELLVTNYLDVVVELSEWRRQSYSPPGVAQLSVREHRRVIRFLENRDQDAAESAMNSHLLRVYYMLPGAEDSPLEPR